MPSDQWVLFLLTIGFCGIAFGACPTEQSMQDSTALHLTNINFIFQGILDRVKTNVLYYNYILNENDFVNSWDLDRLVFGENKEYAYNNPVNKTAEMIFNNYTYTDLYYNGSAYLQGLPDQIDQYCAKWHLDPLTRPQLCNTPAKYNNSIFNFTYTTFKTLNPLLWASWNESFDVAACYFSTNKGAFIYHPMLPIGLNFENFTTAGKNFIFFGNFENRTRDAYITDPYDDPLELGYMVSALAPVYLGNESTPFGTMGCDCLITDNDKSPIRQVLAIAGLVDGAFLLLTDDFGRILYISDDGVPILFPNGKVPFSILDEKVRFNFSPFINISDPVIASDYYVLTVNGTNYNILIRLLRRIHFFYIIREGNFFTGPVIQQSTSAFDSDYVVVRYLNDDQLSVKLNFDLPSYAYMEEEEYVVGRGESGRVKIYINRSLVANAGSYNFRVKVRSYDVEYNGTCWDVNQDVFVNMTLLDRVEKLTFLNYFFIVCCAVVLFIFIFFFIIVVYFRNERVIYNSGILFCILALTGCLIFGIAPLFLTPMLPYCMGFFWCLGVGFVLIYGPLFAKLYRLQVIFQSKNMKYIKLNNHHLIILVMVVLAAELVLLVLWTIFDPYLYKDRIVGTNKFAACTSNTVAPVVVQISLIFAIMIIGTVFAFRVRKIKLDTINEVSEIFQAVYALVLIGAVLIPTSFITSDIPNTFEIITGLGLVLISIIVMLCVFGKKSYRIYRGKGSRTSSSQKGDSKTTIPGVFKVVKKDYKRNEEQSEVL